jgi:plasmid maintenance system antidote protein VapI
MELSELVEKYGGQAALADALGVNRQQINRIIKGHRKVGAKLAVRIFTVTGKRVGPMAQDRAA